ncbi:putative adenylate kinase/UMP-CMP kinase, P-loop containing nucleoside triphosphate hydrolase [Plasmopara halstedii]
MRVFISDLGSSLSTELAHNCQVAGHEVVGTVVRDKTSKVVALTSHIESHSVNGSVNETVAEQSDAISWRRLMQHADVVIVTSLVADPKSAIEMMKAFEKRDTIMEKEGDKSVKRFIAVSSVLSWSKNSPYSASGNYCAHTEDEFKLRRPARIFAELKTAETQILSAHRTAAFETYIVGAGLIYGGVQSPIQMIFREAWLHPDQPLLVPSLAEKAKNTSQGCNFLPMISLYDLALLIFRLAISPSPPSKTYLLAVDKASAKTNLRDICRGVSILLGSGRLRDREDSIGAVDIEADTFLLDEDEKLLASLQLHLCFDTSAGAMHTLVAAEEWHHYSSGLLGNLEFFVHDFIKCMDLRPLRTVILGAPRVGKTLLSQRLAKDYHLPYLSPTTLLHELFVFEIDATHSIPPEANQSNLKTSRDNEEIKSLRKELQHWAPTCQNSAELPEDGLIKLLRWKLCSPACRNQGYVLDGLPISSAQACRIFFDESTFKDDGEGDAIEVKENESVSIVDEADGLNEKSNAEAIAHIPVEDVDALLVSLKPRQRVEIPNRVIVLNASRVILEMRAQMLTESEAKLTGNTEDTFARRFDEFEINIEAVEEIFEKSKPQWEADEAGSNPTTDGVEVLEITLQDELEYCDDASFAGPIKRYMEQGGRTPFNFHPTPAEVREQQRVRELQVHEDEARAAQRNHEFDAQNEALQQVRLARERARLDLVQREEAELLEMRAQPLRAYLMDTVLPALTEGILEVVQVQPLDPVDYLAEFLFRKGQELDVETS